jgi:hypothetical protein
MDGQFKLVTIERDTETGSVRRLPEAKHDKITLPTLVREPLPEPQE